MDSLRGRWRTIFNGRHERVVVEHPDIQARGAAAARFTGTGIQIAVNISGNDGKVRLAQASHHLAHHLTRLLHSDCALELGPQFVVYADPIDAAEAGIPVLVADGGPDQLEGFDIETLLFRGEPV